MLMYLLNINLKNEEIKAEGSQYRYAPIDMYIEMVKLSFGLLILLVSGWCKREVSTNSHSLSQSKHLSTIHKKNLHNGLKYEEKNAPGRCSIYCPIVYIFPMNCTGTSNSTLVSNKVITTNKPSTLNISTQKLLDQNDRNFVRKSKKISSKLHGKSFRIANITHTGNRQYTDKRKYTYHDLSMRQNRLLLKQLNLGNRHGRKAYEFKEISTSLCRIVCLEASLEENIQSNTLAPQRVSTDEGEDSEEDNYVEGEDSPIEATIKPVVPQNFVIGGIRPFGAVNFNGLDDFGPNGELASDISQPDDRRN